MGASDVRTSYGVDFSDAFVAVVRAEGRAGSARTAVLYEGPPAPDDPAWREAVGAARVAGEHDRALCVGAVPAGDGLVRVLTAPFPSLAKAARVWPSLLDVQLPFPLESCATAFVDAARGSDRQVRATALAARRSVLRARRDEARALGFDPAVLTHEGLALWRQSLRESPDPAGAPRAVLYAGAERTVLVLGRGGALAAAFSSRWGRADWDADAPPGSAAARGAETFAARLRRFLQSQRTPREVPAPVVFWCGPAAADADYRGHLEAALPLPGGATFRSHANPGTFLARALALGALAPRGLEANLLDGEDEHPALVRLRRRREHRLLAGAAALLLAVTAVDAGWTALLRTRVDAAGRRLNALARQVTGLPTVPRGFEVAKTRTWAESRAAATEPIAAALAPSLTPSLEAVLETARRAGIRLDTIEMGEGATVLHGSSPDWDLCDRLAAALAEHGWTAQLAREDAGPDERIPFTLRGGRP